LDFESSASASSTTSACLKVSLIVSAARTLQKYYTLGKKISQTHF